MARNTLHGKKLLIGATLSLCVSLEATSEAVRDFDVTEQEARSIAARWLRVDPETLVFERMQHSEWMGEAYSFLQRREGGANLSIAVNAHTAVISSYSDYLKSAEAGQAKLRPRSEHISAAAAVTAARSYLAAAGWDPSVDHLTVFEKSPEQVLWRQLLTNGGIHGGRRVLVYLNPVTGEVCGFYRLMLPYLHVSLTPSLSQEQSLSVAVRAYDRYYPGRYLHPEAPSPPSLGYSDLGQPSLIYFHRLIASTTPYLDSAAARGGEDTAEVDIVIDAHSGSVLSFEPCLCSHSGKSRLGKTQVRWQGRWVDVDRFRRAPQRSGEEWFDPWTRHLVLDGRKTIGSLIEICQRQGVTYLQARELGSPRWKGRLEGRGDQLQIRMPDGASGRITLGSKELMLGGSRRIHLTGPALKRGNRW